MVTHLTTIEDVKGVKHPLILSPRIDTKRYNPTTITHKTSQACAQPLTKAMHKSPQDVCELGCSQDAGAWVPETHTRVRHPPTTRTRHRAHSAHGRLAPTSPPSAGGARGRRRRRIPSVAAADEARECKGSERGPRRATAGQPARRRSCTHGRAKASRSATWQTGRATRSLGRGTRAPQRPAPRDLVARAARARVGSKVACWRAHHSGRLSEMDRIPLVELEAAVARALYHHGTSGGVERSTVVGITCYANTRTRGHRVFTHSCRRPSRWALPHSPSRAAPGRTAVGLAAAAMGKESGRFCRRKGAAISSAQSRSERVRAARMRQAGRHDAQVGRGRRRGRPEGLRRPAQARRAEGRHARGSRLPGSRLPV
mmetsp:Transcript_63640/g.169630  ORF Transcript_63640/g.169630 Transcript_63640/m.169630 type:complete len:371 (+) Transcript_63640:43-1155(+)